MASPSSTLVVQKLGDDLHFNKKEEHAASLLPMGERRDAKDAAELRVCLGPFLKPEVVGREVSFIYLLTEQATALFCPGFSNAQNWNEGKDVYCFPIKHKGVRIGQWYERLSARLGKKRDRLRIHQLIQFSLSPIAINDDVCAALLTCWNLNLNCFFFPDGPLTM